MNTPAYLPTPEEIQRIRGEIQRGWNDARRDARRREALRRQRLLLGALIEDEGAWLIQVA
jgi:hypothetical protein